MKFPLFLAMSPMEIAGNHPTDHKIAYMSCRFAPGGRGLCGLPHALPPGSVLMLSDETPFCGHDAQLVARQLWSAAQRLEVQAVVLDLQRRDDNQWAVVEAVAKEAACPLVVSEPYAAGNDLPVLLPPPGLWTPVPSYLHAWAGRRLWLEAVVESALVTVTESGSHYAPLTEALQSYSFTDAAMHLSYSIKCLDDRVEFYLHRGKAQLLTLLHQTEGIEAAIGLYQQLKE